MKRKIFAGIGAAAIIVAAASTVYALSPSHRVTTTASQKKQNILMHSAVNRDQETAVKQMGKNRAAKLHQMLTRDTILMDKAAYGLQEPDPVAKHSIMEDYQRLVKMFPAQIQKINEAPQLVTGIDWNSLSSGIEPGYVTNNHEDFLTSGLAMIYEAYQSAIYDLSKPNGQKPNAFQKLPRTVCADWLARFNRLWFGNEG